MEQAGRPASGGKMNPTAIVGIVIVVLAGWYFLSRPSANPANVGNPTATPTPAGTPNDDALMEKKDVLGTIDVAASDVAFDFDSKFHDGSGRFTKFTAEGSFDRTDWSQLSGELVIQASSIDTGVPARDTHLKSAELFDVEKNPTLEYKITKTDVDEGNRQLLVTGDLTMLGTTKPVTAPVSVLENADGSVTLKGSLTINRRQWGTFVYDTKSPQNPISNSIPIHITLVYR